MAGVAHSAVLFDLAMGLQLHFLGQTVGIGIPFRQWESGPLTAAPALSDTPLSLAAATRTAAEPGTPDVDVRTARPSVTLAVTDWTTPNQDWFDKVHILPRTKIAVGNIITLVEEDYLIHSAFRTQPITLASVNNNASPGSELPDLTTPLVVYPHESILDPSSTSNNGGTALGTLVQMKVQFLQDGLPVFDTDILFNFSTPANDVLLLVSGQRVVLIPMVYEFPLSETLSFATDILETINGKEQRLALRAYPRQILDVTYRLEGNDRQRMNALLLGNSHTLFGVPVWHEQVFTTAAVSPTTTTYPVVGASQCDFRVGGLAVIVTDNETFDVITIQSVTDTLITSTSPSINGYASRSVVMPLRTAYVMNNVVGERSPVKLESFRIRFEVNDNDTGAQAGSTAPGFWSTYNSRVLFDDPNFVEGAMRQDYPRRIYRIDNDAGKVYQASPWSHGKKGLEKGFVLKTRAQILQFRKLMHALRGRQKAFYIPTFIDDLTVVANLVSGTTTMDIESIEYTRLVQAQSGMKLFKITFTDGSSLIRSVASSVVISNSVERLTLNTTWPANRTVAEVSQVQFYDLVRLDADEIRLRYDRVGLARVNVPLVRVFDDD